MQKSLEITRAYFRDSPEVSKVKDLLEQQWAALGLNHFEQIMDFTECLGLYFEELPRSKVSYIALMIMNCHTLANDKFIAMGVDVTEVDIYYIGLLRNYFNDQEMAYYNKLYKIWVYSCHEEKEVKGALLPDIPIVKQFIWSDWRNVNIGMSGLMKLVIMINFSELTGDIVLLQSAIVYTSLKCALLNDIGSILKDKTSTESNYYLEIHPDTNVDASTQQGMTDDATNYIMTLQLDERLKTILKSALHGSYLLYCFSKRYHGQSKPNW
ncbi:hypothetical protein CONCODRAFT_167047 [Conidiobolus coronatus NRRL 28638]|uniref:Uncharacterized protein n=1 Tax=Conidiobolus coronatus (strain ATCC 28846 / CBS 209.66 / NRRL 28638) TaxID=796925 RepID=A0A137NY97_CONC2|nr:hypothetical protein CONCODRAFT_167047 [Conidiobolus coronatus NRRL 28638]|eukprot:KXN67840.1 hypothetical protein CONCODRAFT_167047 [Conidiobolus coronatus NRRL 28638]